MTPDATEHSIRLSRLVPAPRDRVFEAWTDPDLVARWFAPAPARVGGAELDVREGGGWRVRMTGPEGETYTCEGVYREVDPPARLVFTFDWAEEASRMGLETVVTVTFEETDAGTEVVLVHAGFDGPEQAEGHNAGWTACVDQMVEALG